MSEKRIFQLILAIPVLLLVGTGIFLISRHEVTGGMLALVAGAILFKLANRYSDKR